ncbi:E3 SUMO-protein ligase PIAS2 isoform X2 [Anopheles bellator]|uniref:E3 SUMO-protein ligase PIAS2 isoform X2 n=1 Tax=Anopheles bellator TaxID=139047 RepID=UPI00264735F9|nr:E3 SUMO-protein ligase PIAS2 isoform X2 [Anopheles bellator]
MRKTRQAAEFSELKELVHQLRVSDLQQLLGEHNVSRSGRKTELIERVLILVRQNISVLKHKVRDLHRKALQESVESSSNLALHSAREHSVQPSVSTDSNLALAVQSLISSGLYVGANSDKTSVPNNNNNIHAIANSRAVSAGMYQQQYANTVQNDNRVSQVHANGITTPGYAENPGFPIHPDVRLKKLAFYDVLATLLKPATLVPSNTAQRVQEGSFYFHLTPQQATDVALNRDTRNANRIEHTIQVQLRFCLLETSCEQEDYFPPNIVVKVNNKLCPLPNPIPTNKPGVEPKRPPRPVNITPNVKLSPVVANHITVSWCTEYNRGYAVACYLVRKLTSVQLLQRMKSKGVKPADYTRALIKEKLNEDADCEIATTMLKVSLICPLGKARMITPCRASTCSHLQCFDARLYLQMNERKPTWNCPVCDKPAIYDNLVIDGYFQEVLDSNKLSYEDTEIQLHKDGSWSTHIKQSEFCDESPGKAIQKVEVISDDIVITTDPPKNTIVPQTSVISPNEPTSTTTSNETVDLTLSDSDDEVSHKRKMNNGRSTSSSNNPSSSSSLTGNASAGSAALTRSKVNEDPSSSVISLDSPSPPSTPNPSHNGNNNDVSSTTTLSLAYNHQQQQSPGGTSADQVSNFQINPLALNR